MLVSSCHHSVLPVWLWFHYSWWFVLRWRLHLSEKELLFIPSDIDIAVSSLNLDSNRISEVTSRSLYNFTDLRLLYLQYNVISVIEDGAFDKNNKLEVLKLSNNVLTKLPWSFGPATYSLRLFLATTAIKPEAFRYLNFTNFKNLLTVSLGNNKGLPGNVITKYSKRTKILGLFMCDIETIPDLSIHVPNVRNLGLQQNALVNIHGKGLEKLVKLMQLTLDSNQLQSVPDLFHLPLRGLRLTGNPLECNQSLCWLRMWVWFKPAPNGFDTATCATPDILRGKKLSDVDPVYLRCYQGNHDDVIKWKHFPRYWPFVRGIHQWPVNSPRKGPWRGALIFSLICAWTNRWVNNPNAGGLRRHRAHCDVIIMIWWQNNYVPHIPDANNDVISRI